MLKCILILPFPRRRISDSSKMKEFADDNFKFYENGIKFSKWTENTVGKGEIARYEQFLLFPSVFKRIVLQTRKNQGLFEKGLNHRSNYQKYENILEDDRVDGPSVNAGKK